MNQSTDNPPVGLIVKSTKQELTDICPASLRWELGLQTDPNFFSFYVNVWVYIYL